VNGRFRWWSTYARSPYCLHTEYEAHRTARRYLLATQLLVPVPSGTFWMLKSSGRLAFLEDGTVLADVAYDPELGLLPREIDLDTGFV